MLPKWLKGSRILYCVTGGIAAYKAPNVAREFVKAGVETEIIISDSAARLVSPLALSTVIGRRVWRGDDFLSDERGWQIPHISLARDADALVVAPATADSLARAACGMADTLISAAMLAYAGMGKKMLIFPAMNENMLANPAVTRNIETLASAGHTIWEPDAGYLACGDAGKGRMPSPETIAFATWGALSPKRDLVGRTILITAGPTREYIDPVRFISNPSTGKMGCAIAACALWRGAKVELVLGPCESTPPPGANVTRVTTALEMLDACKSLLPSADAVIKSAAVGDYRAENIAPQKIKRGKAPTMEIKMIRNPDIAHELSQMRRDGQIIVGFAAETNDVIENARAKIASKGLDMIAANDVGEPGSGFGTDTDHLVFVMSDERGGSVDHATGTKIDVADVLLDKLVGIFTCA